MRIGLFLLSILLMSLGQGIAAEKSKKTTDKTTVISIPSDLPPPPSAEEEVPTHPFFSESPANEIMEKIQELEERIEKLEKKGSPLENKKAE